MLYFAVAIREEFYFRNFVIVQGERNVSPVAALLIFNRYFWIRTFCVYFLPNWSFLSALLSNYMGIKCSISWDNCGLCISKKSDNLAVNYSHLVNNVVSATVLRDYLAGNPFY